MQKNLTPVNSASTVQNFDSAPDSQLLDLAALRALTCKSRATLYRWIEQGILPTPRKFGPSRNFWTAGEIRQALGLQRKEAA